MRNISILVTAGLLCAGCAFTQNIDTGRIELPAIQSNDYIIEYQGYVSSYNVFTYNRQNDLWGKSKRNATKRRQNEMRQKFSLFPIKKHCSEGYLKPI